MRLWASDLIIKSELQSSGWEVRYLNHWFIFTSLNLLFLKNKKQKPTKQTNSADNVYSIDSQVDIEQP